MYMEIEEWAESTLVFLLEFLLIFFKGIFIRFYWIDYIINYYSFTIVEVQNTLGGEEGGAARLNNDYREGPNAAVLSLISICLLKIILKQNEHSRSTKIKELSLLQNI